MNATLATTAAPTTTTAPKPRKDRRYNGHKNWNHWNVSLWINNDEGLYRTARDHVRNCSGTKLQAARNFVDDLASCGITQTPDGAPYSVTAVRAAMTGM